MRFTKKLQYGFLLVLYICRAGRATLEGVSKSLNLSKNFLAQVARQLRQAGVIKTFRGPDGGYELVGEPTVADVYFAIEKEEWQATQHDAHKLSVGGFEKRALSSIMTAVNGAVKEMMDLPVKDVNTALVNVELAQLRRVGKVAH